MVCKTAQIYSEHGIEKEWRTQWEILWARPRSDINHFHPHSTGLNSVSRLHLQTQGAGKWGPYNNSISWLGSLNIYLMVSQPFITFVVTKLKTESCNSKTGRDIFLELEFLPFKGIQIVQWNYPQSPLIELCHGLFFPIHF